MSDLEELQARAATVTSSVTGALLDRERLQIVKAPPGAGKTHLLLELLAAGSGDKMRLAVATFTNAQADEICQRLEREYPHISAVRFISGSALEPDVHPPTQVVRETKKLPHGPCVVVATTAKWSAISCEPFDVLLVDEAWQIAWADFLMLRGTASRFVLIGDPGQIPPVVSIPTDRWETSPNPPHIPTPELLIAQPSLGTRLHELPGTRRLPADAAALVNEFYDFEFGAFAAPKERYVRLGTNGAKQPLDRALDLLADTSVVGVTIPTPDDGPPVEIDDKIAQEVSALVARLLERDATASHDAATMSKPRPLGPKDIGIVATHRVMNTHLHHELPPKLRNQIRVDTPERWQGLERKVMIAVHPLSGATEPTSFELETGRLCVMASRHRCALIVVARDHIPDTLRGHIVSAEQPVGRIDSSGLGHQRHSRFWDHLARTRLCRGAVIGNMV